MVFVVNMDMEMLIYVILCYNFWIFIGWWIIIITITTNNNNTNVTTTPSRAPDNAVFEFGVDLVNLVVD